MSDAYRLTRIDDLERVPLEAGIWRPIRRALGMTSVAINAYTGAKAGDEVIEPHDETSAGAGGHEELYFVVSGEADVRDRRRVGRRAGRDDDPDRRRNPPFGNRQGRRDHRPRHRRPARRGAPGVAVRALVRGRACVPRRRLRARLRDRRRRDSPTTPSTRASTTSSPATAPSPATPRGRYGTSGSPLQANPDVLEWAADDDDLDSIRDQL